MSLSLTLEQYTISSLPERGNLQFRQKGPVILFQRFHLEKLESSTVPVQTLGRSVTVELTPIV
jgi:hypothetical protein